MLSDSDIEIAARYLCALRGKNPNVSSGLSSPIVELTNGGQQFEILSEWKIAARELRGFVQVIQALNVVPNIDDKLAALAQSGT